MDRKQLEIRVSWITTYGVPPSSPEEEVSDDGVDVLSDEEEHPTAHGHQQYHPLAAVSTTPHPPVWPASEEDNRLLHYFLELKK